jgi:hypothetical protein
MSRRVYYDSRMNRSFNADGLTLTTCDNEEGWFAIVDWDTIMHESDLAGRAG